MDSWREFQLASGIVTVPEAEVDEFRSFAEENGDEYSEIRRYDTPKGRVIVPVEEEDEFLGYVQAQGDKVSRYVPEGYEPPKQQEEPKKEAPEGAVEKLKSLKEPLELAKITPFVGSAVKASETLRFKQSVDRLVEDNYEARAADTRKEYEAAFPADHEFWEKLKENPQINLMNPSTFRNRDLEYIGQFLKKLERETTVGADVVSVISELPAFVVELLLTGGFYKAAKESVERTALKGMNKAVLSRVAGVSAQAAAMTTRTLGNAVQKMLPEFHFEGNDLDDLIVVIDKEGSPAVKAAFQGWLDTSIEIASERAGEKITGLARKVPMPKAVMDFLSKAKSDTATKILEKLSKLGIQSMPVEVLEERIGDAARYVTGLEDWESVKPTKRKLITESIAFMIPGVTASAVGHAFDATRKLKGEDRIREMVKQLEQGQQKTEETTPTPTKSEPVATLEEESKSRKVLTSNEKPMDLRSAVTELGGIRSYQKDPSTGRIPWAEEMRSLPPRYKRKDGLPLDKMVEQMKEAGWLSSEHDESDLIEMLQGGRKVLSGEDKHYRDMAEAERIWRREESEPLEPATLKQGDKFTIQGEAFQVLEETDTALHIKDGEEFWLPYEADESIRIDRESLVTQEAEKAAEELEKLLEGTDDSLGSFDSYESDEYINNLAVRETNEETPQEEKEQDKSLYPEREWSQEEQERKRGIPYTRINANDTKVRSTFLPRWDRSRIQLSEQEQADIDRVYDLILEHNYRVDSEWDNYEDEVYAEDAIPTVDHYGRFAPSKDLEHNRKFIEVLDSINPKLSNKILREAFEATLADEARSHRASKKSVTPESAEDVPIIERELFPELALLREGASSYSTDGKQMIVDAALRYLEAASRGKALDKKSASDMLTKRFGDSISSVLEDVLNALPTAEEKQPSSAGTSKGSSASPMPGVPGFLGKPSPYKNVMDDNQPQRLMIEMPELVALSEDLLDGKHPQIKESLRALFGTAAGVFKYQGKSGSIELRADIFDLVPLKEKVRLRKQAEEDIIQQLGLSEEEIEFKDPETIQMMSARYDHMLDEAYEDAKKLGPGYASKVLAHEIGHVIDWLPEHLLRGRGNILGRIAGLRRYMKKMLGEVPENQESVLTPKERQRIRREAEREIGKRPPKDEKAELEAWQAEVKRIYDAEIKVQAEDRGLLTQEGIKSELQELIAWWHGEEEMPPYYEKPEEMYAETLSVLLNNPAALAKRAPNFYHSFFAWMKNKPRVRRLYDQVQADIKSGRIYRDRVQRLHQAFADSDAKDLRIRRSADKLTKSEILDDARYSIDRMFGPIYRRLGKSESAGKVKHALENELYKGSEHELFMARVNEIVLDKLVANNIDWIQFGEYLFHQRVIHERFNMANPKGFTAKASNERLAEMQKELGGERYAQLEEASLWFRKVYQEQVVDLLKGSEVIDDSLMQVIEDRIFYATFAAVRGEAVLESDEVMSALDSRYGKAVSSRIYRQIGNLGNIKNPASATMEKAVSLISMAYRETAKREVADWLLSYSPSEIKSAEMRWTGKRREAVHIENDRIGTIEYLHKGKVKSYYVPKAIAESFNSGHPIENRLIIASTKYLTNPLKMLYTGANYGFWPVAFMRDMFDFARRMPKASLFGKRGYWKYHLKAWRAARSSVRGGMDPVAEEALKRKMLISVANPLGLNPEEQQFERLLARYHQNPASWKNKTLTPMEKIAGALRSYMDTGQIGERTVKIAGMLYLDEHFSEMPEWQKQQMIHMHAGSPNFLQKGKANALLDFMFLFYNPWKEGVRSEYDAWKRSKAEWLWKNTKYSVLPKVAMWAAASGGLAWLIGDDDSEEMKKMYDSISEYDKTNYMCVPLGWADKEKEKVTYIRMPMSEGQRVLSGLTWKMLNRRKDPRSKSGEGMLSFAGGQLPSGNPILNVGNAWLEYLVFGRNPYDKFRGRSVLREDVFEAKDEKAIKKLGKWSANQLGAGVLTRFSEESLYDGEKTKLEKFLNLPVISNAIGRWIKVSNRGIYDKMVAAAEPVREERARKRLNVQDNVKKLLDDDLPPDQFFKMLMDPYQKDYLGKKLPEVILNREFSPTVRSILNAGSKQEREHLAVEMMR